MQYSRFDLNLFVVFDAIYRERHLSRAADRLCLSQPAVSNALARLRSRFDDPLFVRVGRGMRPTPRAESLAPRVRQALQLLELGLAEDLQFAPGEAERSFRISMNDLVEAMLLPSLMARLQREAPGVRLESYYVPRAELPRAMAAGQVDVALDAPLITDESLAHRPLLREPYVCLMRPGHPAADRPLDLERYLQLGQVHVSSRPQGAGQVDVALNKLGRRRQILLRISHYLLVPRVLRSSDLAASLPARLAVEGELEALPLPFDMEPLETHLYWPHSLDDDPANRWLREQVINAVVP